MNGIAVAFTLCVVIVVVYCVWVLLVYVPRLRRTTQKYPLFAVRDELVTLKLKGKFDDDPDLYDFLCGACNHMIAHTKDLNFTEFERQLSNIERDWEAEYNLHSRLLNAPAEVREVEQHLWEAALNILIDNSLALKIMIGIRFPLASMRIFGGPIKHYVKIERLKDACPA